MEKIAQSVIGVRKMIVIMWCAMAIVAIVALHLHYKTPMDNSTLVAIASITALGGAHVIKQGQIDEINKKKGV